MAPTPAHSQMKAQIQRLEEVLQSILERHPHLGTQEEIAREMGYSRPATISDYKNPKLYSEAKMRHFAQLLSLYFRVNPAFLLEGQGRVFLPEGKALSDQPMPLRAKDIKQRIQSLELACRLLETQLQELRNIQS